MEWFDPSLTHSKSHTVDVEQNYASLLKQILRQVCPLSISMYVSHQRLPALFTPAVWETVISRDWRKTLTLYLYGEVTSNRFQRLNNFHHNERGVRRNERDRERGGSLEHHVDYYNEKERERKRERWSEDSVKSPLWTQQCGRWPSCHRKTPGLLIKWQGGW